MNRDTSKPARFGSGCRARSVLGNDRNGRTWSLALCVSSTAMTLSSSWPARAQTDTPAVPAAPPLDVIHVGDTPVSAPARGDATDAGDAVQLGAVTVTGELLKRDADRTTSSVTVLTGKQIERSTARDVYDVLRDTPNVAVHDDSNGFGSLTIRGIPSYGANTQGGAYIYSSATSIVLDGVGLPRAAQAYSDLSAFDLDRVEIYRGPQSTSQGRNAMAGAVLITSQPPLLSPEPLLDSLAVKGRIAGNDEVGYQGALALDATPLPEVLGLRLSTDNRSLQGDIKNITLNDDGWAKNSSHGYRLLTAWEPNGTEGAYKAQVSLRDLNRYNGSRYTEQVNERAREATANEPTFTRSQAQLLSLDQSYAFNRSWSLRAVSAVVHSHTYSSFDLDYSAANSGVSLLDQPGRGYSQELRLRYEGETIRATFGGYYFAGRDYDSSNSSINTNALLQYEGACALSVACSVPLGNIISVFSLATRIEDAAAFGEADWRLLDRLTLTAGIRLDRERNKRSYTSVESGDTVEAQAAVTTLQDAGILGPNGTETVERQFSTVLPKVALVYEVFTGWFAGATYSQGYRPGGGGYNPTSQRRFEFDSEHTDNYELSLKGGYRPWHLEGALSGFHTKWKDMQVVVGSGFDQYVENAGLSEIDGGELELRFTPMKRLRFISGLGLTHGRFTDYQSAAGNYTGNPLPRAPKSTASLAIEWRVTDTLLLRPDLLFEGGTPAQPDDGPAHQLPAYTLLNLSLRWQQSQFGLFVTGSNLTDRFYRTDAATYGLLSTEISSSGLGRLISAGVDFEFR